MSLSTVCDDLTKFNSAAMATFYSGDTPVELSKSGYWKRMQSTGLLVIDEIGTREATGHRFDTLLTILESRKGKPLILTGNLMPDKIATVYDERVLSRIFAGTLVEFTGKDRRFNGAADRIYQA